MTKAKRKGKDPAFLFYPGDASEDTQFMNRLERGCYFDLLKAQKKFRKFTLDQIKKVLGADFDLCWQSIELVLTKVDDHYFISWVHDAIENRKAHSDKQKENISKRWNNNGNTMVLPNDENGKTLVIPLENENENGIINENIIQEDGTGETKTPTVFHASHGQLLLDIDLLLQKVIHDIDGFVRIYAQQGLDKTKLEQWLENFNKWLRFTGASKKLERDYRTHFSNWLATQDLSTDPKTYQPTKINSNGNTNRRTATERSTATANRGL